MYKVGILKITREYDGVTFIHSDFTKDEEMQIMRSMKLGSPRLWFAKIEPFQGQILLQVISKSSDQNTTWLGLVLIKEINMEITHEFIEKLNQYSDFIENFFFPSYNDTLKYFSKFHGLENLLYALFTKKAIVIVNDSKEKISNFMNFLFPFIGYLSTDLLKKRTIVTHSEYHLDETDIIGIVGGSCTIEVPHVSVDLDTNEVNGFNSSLVIEKLVDLLQNDKYKEFSDHIHYIFEVVKYSTMTEDIDIPKNILLKIEDELVQAISASIV